MTEFRLFNRGRAHERLAVVARSNGGAFRHIVEVQGQYAVVVENERGAPAAVVSLDVSTDINPNSGAVARELPAGRRLAVILVSFALFFAMVAWSAAKLMRAMK